MQNLAGKKFHERAELCEIPELSRDDPKAEDAF